jgi:hypothetical protein
MHVGVTKVLVIWIFLSILIKDFNCTLFSNDRSVNCRYTDTSKYYGSSLFKKIFCRKWTNWYHLILSWVTVRGSECVSNELWSKCVATGQTQYGDCEFESEDGEVPEEHPRWRRSIFRKMSCAAGSRKVNGRCRPKWG